MTHPAESVVFDALIEADDPWYEHGFPVRSAAELVVQRLREAGLLNDGGVCDE